MFVWPYFWVKTVIFLLKLLLSRPKHPLISISFYKKISVSDDFRIKTAFFIKVVVLEKWIFLDKNANFTSKNEFLNRIVKFRQMPLVIFGVFDRKRSFSI